MTTARSAFSALILLGSAQLATAAPALAELPEETEPFGAAQPPAPGQPPVLMQPPGPAQPRFWEDYAYRMPAKHPAPEIPALSWDPQRFGVALESRTTWPQNDGAKRLAGTRAPAGGGLSVRGEILRPSDRITVELDLSWITTKTSQSQEGTALAENLTSNLISLGASLRYQILPWLAPYARLAGGGGRDDLKVQTYSSGAGDLSNRQTYGQGSLGAGVFLRSPTLRLWQSMSALRLGLIGRVEGGYSLAASNDVTLHSSPASESPTPIPTSTVAIGKVERNAPYLRVSVGIAF